MTVKLDITLEKAIKKLMSLDDITNKEMKRLEEIDDTTEEGQTLDNYLFVINTYQKYLTPRVRQAETLRTPRKL